MPRGRSLVYYPAQLDVRGAAVLVVGGGDVALRKVQVLLDAGAAVTVVSPEFHEEFAALKSRATVLKRGFKASDVRGKRLVFAATNVETLNVRIAVLAKKLGAWVNVAAPPEAGNFAVPSHFRRGGVLVAISTGGASAALAKSLRERLESALGEEWGVAAELLEARRETILKRITDAGARRKLLQKLGSAETVRAIKKMGPKAVAKEMDRWIREAALGARAGEPKPKKGRA